jgi:hypothetical protein
MRASENEIDIELQAGDLVTRSVDWGGQSVRYLSLPPGADMRPLLAGLPEDACHCPHWGYMLEGSMTVLYADGTEEVSRAGDVFYWPGNHTGWTDEGATFVEFSPAAEWHPVLEHIGAQLAPS